MTGAISQSLAYTTEADRSSGSQGASNGRGGHGAEGICWPELPLRPRGQGQEQKRLSYRSSSSTITTSQLYYSE